MHERAIDQDGGRRCDTEPLDFFRVCDLWNIDQHPGGAGRFFKQCRGVPALVAFRSQYFDFHIPDLSVDVGDYRSGVLAEKARMRATFAVVRRKTCACAYLVLRHRIPRPGAQRAAGNLPAARPSLHAG
jgi:hypothetical protein